MSGVFITFEGGEGSGKTTIAKLVKEILEKEGYVVTLTREPGGVEIAERIRDIITNVCFTQMDRKTEALLYAASRVSRKARPVCRTTDTSNTSETGETFLGLEAD